MTTIDTSRIEQDLRRIEDEERALTEQVIAKRREVAQLKDALDVLKRYGLVEGEEQLSVYSGMTIAQAIKAYLRSVGGTAKVLDIRAELERARLLKGKKESRYGTLIQTMQRHERTFEKAGRGVWRLIDRDAVEPTDIERMPLPDAPASVSFEDSNTPNGVGVSSSRG